MGIICPHCVRAIHENWTFVGIGMDRDSASWEVAFYVCPACQRILVALRRELRRDGSHQTMMVYPKATARPLPPEVPDPYAADFREAALVLADSPKASAAISRRLLQHIIREQAGIRGRDLNDEIDRLLDSKQLPSHLAESVDAIRNVGNFAAHPTKSTNTSEIIDVEPGEAEWLLDALEGLTDFYFVQPARTKARREALNKKLGDAGKPPMK